MKLLALLLVCLAGCGGCVSVPPLESLRETTLSLFSSSATEGWVCSGTAIGPSTLRTAKHCIDGAPLRTVNGQAVEVASMVVKGDDETDITLTKPMFKHWAKVGPTPKQGDRIRYWGNPLGIANVYREGVVVAVTDKVIAVQLQVCHGDSGAGMFNDKGELVGVVVRMLPEQSPCTFMVGQR